jgi:hypothetical protein
MITKVPGRDARMIKTIFNDLITLDNETGVRPM